MDKLTFHRWLAPVLVIILIAAVVGLNRIMTPEPGPALRVNCPNPGAGCATTLNGRRVELGMTGELKVLNPIDIWLKAANTSEVRASFTMEGMDMGFNLYTLRPDANGIFHARVTLPVCVTGRRDWLMTLTVDGQAIEMPFVTDL